jgi:ferredoxin
VIQITHLREKCIGCNACVESAPEYWVISKADGKSHLKKAKHKGRYYNLNAPDFALEENLEAAKNCPVNIISVKKL